MTHSNAESSEKTAEDLNVLESGADEKGGFKLEDHDDGIDKGLATAVPHVPGKDRFSR